MVGIAGNKYLFDGGQIEAGLLPVESVSAALTLVALYYAIFLASSGSGMNV